MLPSRQAELIKAARGDRTQAEFARALGVDRTCLSRYEREILGAPPSVINHCLAEVARQQGKVSGVTPVDQALAQARELVKVLESLSGPTGTHS